MNEVLNIGRVLGNIGAKPFSSRKAAIGVMQGYALPLCEHVARYERAILATGRMKYARTQASILRRLFQHLGVSHFSQLRADAVQVIGYLPVSRCTQRAHTFALKRFTRWMICVGAAVFDPLASVPPPRRQCSFRTRRTLHVFEMNQLLKYLASPDAQTRWAVTPHDRRMLYATAVSAGMRAGELRELQRENLRLDEVPPRIKIAQRYSTNASRVVIPLPGDLASVLREYVRGLPACAQVFRITHHVPLAVLLRDDLKAAGVSVSDDSSDVVDFHSLRATAIKWWLHEYKLPLVAVQHLARLKSMALVNRFCRVMTVNDLACLTEQSKLVLRGTDATTLTV